MFPNLDPKKMQAVMKQMGISQEEIDASKVIIEKADNTKIIIDNPSVTRVKMSGNETFQISGDIREVEEEKFSEQDIKTVMEKTGCSYEEAKYALEEKGDLAEAIMKLSNI